MLAAPSSSSRHVPTPEIMAAKDARHDEVVENVPGRQVVVGLQSGDPYTISRVVQDVQDHGVSDLAPSVQEEVVKSLVELFVPTPQAAVQALCTVALYSPAPVMRAPGVWDGIAKMLQAGGPNAQHAAAVISNVTFHASTRDEVGQHPGILTGLVMLLQSSRGPTQETAAGALCNLAFHEANCTRMRATTAPDALLKILLSSENESVVARTGGVLSFLAVGMKIVEEALASNQGRQALGRIVAWCHHTTNLKNRFFLVYFLASFVFVEAVVHTGGRNVIELFCSEVDPATVIGDAVWCLEEVEQVSRLDVPVLVAWSLCHAMLSAHSGMDVRQRACQLAHPLKDSKHTRTRELACVCLSQQSP